MEIEFRNMYVQDISKTLEKFLKKCVMIQINFQADNQDEAENHPP